MNRLGKVLVIAALLLPASLQAQDIPVSFQQQVLPILRANCIACHKPGKTKGKLDLTSYAALMKGGEDGQAIKPGEPQVSRLIEDISGDEPEMPEEGEPLTADEVTTISL